MNSSIVGSPSMSEKANWSHKKMLEAIDKGDIDEARKFKDIEYAYRRRL